MLLPFTFVLAFCCAVELILQKKWIAVMKRMKIEQVTKLYGPAWHEKTKMGTPTMGGVVFIPALILSLPLIMLFAGDHSAADAMRILLYPLLAAGVGFTDDWLKYSRHSSDGLTSLSKLLLQTAVTLPWALWASRPPYELLPWLCLPFPLYVAVVTFIGVGLQNAVNVTDGLDGLAAGCSLISFFAALALLPQSPMTLLSAASACGICLGFLWHNANPASVFMGDVGAHFLDGFMLSLCINSGALIMVVPLCFIFGVEIFSVAIQIFAIHKLHRKLFLMSPIHHHFEMLGWKETQITARFYIAHIVGICLLSALLHCFVFLLRI